MNAMTLGGELSFISNNIHIDAFLFFDKESLINVHILFVYPKLSVIYPSKAVPISMLIYFQKFLTFMSFFFFFTSDI